MSTGIYIFAGIVILLVVLQHLERRELYNRIAGEPVKQQRGKVENPVSRHEQVLHSWRNIDKDNR